MIEDFGVRTSGSMASIHGKDQEIQFRSDSIKHIEDINEIQLTEAVWRKIQLSFT